jgi:hypothetical protein
MNSDLNDSLDDIFGAPSGNVRTAQHRGPADYAPKSHEENCVKCSGTGSWRPGYKCFGCDGTGKVTFKTPLAKRNKLKAKRQDSAVQKEQRNAEAFKLAFPDVQAWIDASPNFAFAVSMQEAIRKWGRLTDGQMAACRKCMDGRRKAVEASAAREVSAPAIAVTRIEEAFLAAKEAGLKWPKLHLETFVFKPAGVGKNSGSIYVTERSCYLGRVTAGKFICTAACSPEQLDSILAAAADPEAAAKAYGHRTGKCSCCGRPLTAGASIDLGIGPICANKYGW